MKNDRHGEILDFWTQDLDLVIRQVAGSMALSGFILTKEDEIRIREHTGTPVDVVAEVARLVEKHKRGVVCVAARPQEEQF